MERDAKGRTAAPSLVARWVRGEFHSPDHTLCQWVRSTPPGALPPTAADEVKDRLDKPGGGLSGGQQQRLCIARAIAVSPDVLLMDEPCSALDPISTLAIEDLIQELKQDFTIVIVTHNMQQAARVSDQTGFFNLEATGKPGKLIEIDDTEKIFSNPTQKATEDYISGRFG